MVELSPLQIKNIKMQIEKILHVPGNFTSDILEFAIVLDYHIEEQRLRTFSAELIRILKSTDKVFRNARLNLVKWIDDENIIKEVSAMGILQMGRCFEDYEPGQSEKLYDELIGQLKKFYARSKLIILVTDGSYQIQDEQKVKENLNPFLHRKLMEITI